MTPSLPRLPDPVVILGARRTPIGSFLGQFQTVAAPALGGVAIDAALADARVSGLQVSEVLMGQCLMAGVGQAPARQALVAAGLPHSVPATTLSKMCGSGMKTAMLAHDQLLAGTGKLFVAGGMESMSRAPYLLPTARQGQRLGHGTTLDHMFFDGLQDAYDGHLMGWHADHLARQLGFDRASQDAWARQSVERAQRAVVEGWFKAEIATVVVPGAKGAEPTRHATDETPGKCRPDKIAHLSPAFGADGVITPASSASISDGAAALVLSRESFAQSHALEPLATLRAHSTHAAAPGNFASAPVGAIEKLLVQVGWSVDDVDLWEINEAFALVPLIALRELAMDAERVNILGSACALGHPIGATGARLIVTLVHALRRLRLRRGVAALCIGGGEATAVAIEVP